MTTALSRLTVFILIFLASLAFVPRVAAATPMVHCHAGMNFLVDQPREAQPAEHELLLTLAHLPGFVPVVGVEDGYDFCVAYMRYQADVTLPPLNTGTLTATVYRLNKRERWKKVTRLTKISVSDNVAFRCKNVRKTLEVGTRIRWVFRLTGMPALDYFDQYSVEGIVTTGGLGDLIFGPIFTGGVGDLMDGPA